MKIAIIGAGFAGLALAYWLTRIDGNEVVLIDRLPIGEGTSGLAAGLLHPYRSSSFHLNWNADACMKESLYLLDQASSVLDAPCYSQSGILRPLTSQKEWDLTHMDDIEFWHGEKTASIPHIEAIDAVFLKRGVTVDCPSYLKGLFRLCTIRGMHFEQRSIATIQELTAFDHVAITCGANVSTIAETRSIAITPIKGQLLEFALPKPDLLPLPIFAKAYIIARDSSLIMGATFERRFSSEEADCIFAEKDLREKVKAFSPYYADPANMELLACKTGLRATTKDHRPSITQVSSKCSCLTGLGSRGLLYHALMAKELAQQITCD